MKYDSPFWKDIIKSLNSWKVGHGHNVSFWFDSRLFREPLCLLVDVIDPTELLLTVDDVLQQDRKLDVDKIDPNHSSNTYMCSITTAYSQGVGLYGLNSMERK